MTALTLTTYTSSRLMKPDEAATQTWLHEEFIELFFPERSLLGRRLPDVKDAKTGKTVFGPWREYTVRPDGKRAGVLIDVHPNMIAMHRSGTLDNCGREAALMAYQISTTDQAIITAIDLDVVGENHGKAPEHFNSAALALEAAMKIKSVAGEMGLTVWLEKTKSGGYRVHVFHRHVPAAHARAIGHLFLKQAGLHPKIEVFPKEDYFLMWRPTGAVLWPFSG